MKTASRKASKTTTKATKTTKEQTTKEQSTNLFLGTVPATKVYHRTMSEFKNCTATCWMIYNEKEAKVTFANSYNGNTPKLSYDPSHYTYTYNPKVHDKKMDEMTEMEVTEWPAWITNMNGRKSRKAK